VLDPDILMVFIFVFGFFFPLKAFVDTSFVCQSMGTGFGECLNLNLCTQIGLPTWVSF
jgi:hypothetical protein